MPFNGGFNHFLQSVLSLPSKAFQGLCRVANKVRCVPGAAREMGGPDLLSSCNGHNTAKLGNAVTFSRPQVEGIRRLSGQEPIEGQEVGAGEVGDVDKIADSGPIRRVEVIPENVKDSPRIRRFDSERYEMGFRHMDLPDVPPTPGGVEIPEVDVGKIVGRIEVRVKALRDEFGGSVRANGVFGHILGDLAVLRPVDGAGGRKDEVPIPSLKHGLGHAQAPGDVVTVVKRWNTYRFPNVSFPRQVDNPNRSEIPHD